MYYVIAFCPKKRKLYCCAPFEKEEDALYCQEVLDHQYKLKSYSIITRLVQKKELDENKLRFFLKKDFKIFARLLHS